MRRSSTFSTLAVRDNLSVMIGRVPVSHNLAGPGRWNEFIFYAFHDRDVFTISAANDLKWGPILANIGLQNQASRYTIGELTVQEAELNFRATCKLRSKIGEQKQNSKFSESLPKVGIGDLNLSMGSAFSDC